MKRSVFNLSTAVLTTLIALTACGPKEMEFRIVGTSDVHANYYPYDFVADRPASGSLARVQSYLRKQRATWDDRLIYVDNGDIIQGQPTSYYYNTVAVASPHLADQILNYMGCEIGTLGNHEIETGGITYQRYILDADFPILGANIMLEGTDHNFIPPYKVIERHGVKIAFIGMLTPAIPNWLPRELWRELKFVDIESSARRWVPFVQEKEQPDVIIGMFHSGLSGGITTDSYAENATEQVAREVPGFDAIIFGHDHRLCCDSVVNIEGKTVPIVNPANGARHVAQLTLSLKKEHGKWVLKHVDAENVSVADYEPDPYFMDTFAPQMEAVKKYVAKRIGTFKETLTTQDAYFGPCPFMDFIHQMQLDITRADISLAAPLSMNATIEAGDVYVRDMFNLYRYENMLYTMLLKGREVRDHLEMSYSLWANQMRSANDHLLLFDESKGESDGDKNTGKGRPKFKNIYYNFDSAAGIRYEVDVTKPVGQRVRILSMADGRPFDLDKTYRVAVNSYRGNGGGELLTRGAGIPQEELRSRVDYSTDADLRFYMLSYIEARDTIVPSPVCQWRFFPEKWTIPAAQRDKKLLFE
ncbi:MAG: 5'-nucleotidase C-terminal domain-containing protein [Bacteroidaceae bacterium]|nr:5'-nucleotidase C-terminal domain-containing protein [Bacteroidaceae bacterium]MBR4779403.1 5'-nucleotidase C-terminal domain-containing protein [Bacteroidaceae bacterium]